MEGGAIFHDSDSDHCAVVTGVAGQKAKRGKLLKGDSASVGVGAGAASRNKILADITNMDQQQQPKLHPAPLAAPATNITSDLLKENAMLMKLLANRNLIIESCKAELQKWQSNFQKLRKQNSELALTNSQMMAELSSGRQRIRELQHELGSKNGVIKAMKIELTAKECTAKLKHEMNAKEVRASQNKRTHQAIQEDNRGEAKRKRVSKSQSSAPAVTKQVKSTEKADNRRCSIRKKSAALKAEEPGPAEDIFEVDEIKYDASCQQENLVNKTRSTSLGSEVHEEAREDAETSGHTNTEQVHAKRNVEKKRHSMRRQSSRFRPEIPEPTEDFFDIDDTKFSVLNLCDEMSEKSLPSTSGVSSGHENNACTLNPHEFRRSSVGRPIRRSVEKVVSYKEIPRNIKMRRAD